MNPSLEEELEKETQPVVNDDQQTIYEKGKYIDLSTLPLITVEKDQVMDDDDKDLKY